MASREVVTDTQSGFGGGDFNFAATEPTEATNVYASTTNMRVVRDHDMAKRPGMRLLLSPPSTPYFLACWFPSASAPVLVYCTTADGVLRYASFDPTTGAVTPSATASTTPITGENTAGFRDASGEVFYMTKNADKITKFDGATVTTGIGTPASINSIWVYNQRLFGCKTSDQTLYFSGLNNGDTLGDTANGGGSATIRTYGNGAVIGGFALGGSNYIMHREGLSVFTGRTFDDIQIQAGTQGVSPDVRPLPSAGGQPWAVVDLVGYIATYRGLYFVQINGAVQSYEEVTGMPDPILALLRQNMSVTVLGIADNARANEVWISLLVQVNAGANGTTTTLIYNKKLRRFTGSTSGPSGSILFANRLTAGGGWNSSAVITQLFVLSGFNGLVYGCDFAVPTLEVYQDAGVSYTSSVTCRRMFTNHPKATKAYRTALVQMGAGADNSVAVGTATGAILSATTPTGTVADATSLKAVVTNRIQLSGQGQYIDLTVTDNGATSTPWSVQGIDIVAFDYGNRGI